MTDLQGVAAILSAVAWPVAVVISVGLARRELVGLLHRLESVAFPFGKLTFNTLENVEKAVAAAAKDAPATAEEEVVRNEAAQFRELQELAWTAPRQAVVDAWGALEYQLNVAADRLAPDQPHGWPQVAPTLEKLPDWPVLRPAVAELRRLRDYTVRSNQTPSSVDAARYVAAAQDIAATIMPSFKSPRSNDPGSGR